MRANTLVTWNERDSPRRLISKGRKPEVTSPLRRISPEVGLMWPEIRLNVVDLPAPLGPMMA
ncbi:hypothetical protein ABIA28_008156 [Bradyrhizobium elkanii]